MKQKTAFLYLDTGGGHAAPARALARALETRHPDDSISVLHHGFAEGMPVVRFFFEDGYRMTSNYFEEGYVLFYQMTFSPLSIHFGNYFVELHGLRKLKRFLRQEGITKVVCLHEVLIMVTRKAIDQVNPSIPLITIVTDPYTAHPLWFYKKNMDIVVFSEKLKREAIRKYHYPAERIHTFPFILSPAYDTPYTDEQKKAVRERLGIPLSTPVLLIAGGGEGLRHADRLVREYVKSGMDACLLVVCGRNRVLLRQIRAMIRNVPSESVRVFGFIDYMADLLNIADCIVTKGGASTVMEVLAVRKPVIFSSFIRGQELGNVLFAVHSGAGWHIPKPADIIQKAREVFSNPAISEEISHRIASLRLKNGTDELADFIHDFPVEIRDREQS